MATNRKSSARQSGGALQDENTEQWSLEKMACYLRGPEETDEYDGYENNVGTWFTNERTSVIGTWKTSFCGNNISIFIYNISDGYHC